MAVRGLTFPNVQHCSYPCAIGRRIWRAWCR